MRRAAGGDAAALDDLVAEWLPEVERLVALRAPRQLLLQESRADLAQSVCRDALVRVQQGGVQYQGDAPLRAWLLGAVELKLKERWRHHHAQKREGSLAPPLDVGVADPAHSHTSPSMAAERSELAASFRAHIDKLDARSQVVVRQVYFEGRSHSDVARQLDITASHSRTLLARALARLASIALPHGNQL